MNSPYVDPMSGRQYGTRYDGTRISTWGGHFLAPLPVPPSKPTPAEVEAAKACVKEFKDRTGKGGGA